jgi:DNA invertase Pin-like site-specific DNA recombinase
MILFTIHLGCCIIKSIKSVKELKIMTLYGYSRCSTDEIPRQIRELIAMGVDERNIFKEHKNETILTRAELHKLMGLLQEGDNIVCTEVSRIARNTWQLCEIVELAKSKKIKLVLGSFIVDCTKDRDPMTEGILKSMEVFSKLERDKISSRIKGGVAKARAEGKLVGRPPLKLSDIPKEVIENYEYFSRCIIGKTDYAKLCNISRPTLDKYIEVIINDNAESSSQLNQKTSEFTQEDYINDLQTKIDQMIHELGVPAHVKGFNYLKLAIAMVVEDKDLIGAVAMYKKLYPAIAKENNTSSSRVGRAIKHAVQVAQSRGNPNKLFEIGYTEETAQTALEELIHINFIKIVADKLRRERKIP